MTRKKSSSQEAGLSAGALVERHLGPLSQVTTTLRAYPAMLRADLQRSLDALLDGARLYGLFRARGPVRLAHLWERSPQVTLAPVEYEELDVGEKSPIRCLRSGLWLVRRPEPLAVLLAVGEDGSVQLEVASRNPPEAWLQALDGELARGACYRGRLLSLGPSERVRVHRLPAVRREEVILPERTVKLLERNVTDFTLQRPRLKRMGMPVKKGLLFYGPPGTGKTHTLRYLTGMLPDHTTLVVTAEQVTRLHRYLEFARFMQPCLLVIEDIDLIGRDRSQMGMQDELLLNELLNEMDGLREDAEVIFILTTNRPEELEPALSSRPGRIDQAIEFPMPDDEGRRKLIQLYARGLQVEPRAMSGAVMKTGGASPAFIKELMRRAAQYYLRDGGKGKLQPPHLDQALSEMVFEGGSLNLKLLGASQEMAREPAFRWSE